MQPLTGEDLHNSVEGNTLIIEPVNEVHSKVIADNGIKQELVDFFTFEVPGAKFMPAYRNRYWDGKVRLYNGQTKLIYKGLVDYCVKFAEDRGYKVLKKLEEVKKQEIETYHLDLPLKPRDYQLNTFRTCINAQRRLILSPTASGKSLVIYMLTQHYKQDKVLVVVPTTSLVYQMKTDFESYNCKEAIHTIMSGKEKTTDDRIVISTWQSIYNQPNDWFDQFDVVIGDEAHLYKAKSLTKIMEKLKNTKYRFGFTGTLDGSQTHKLVLEGLFGPVFQPVTTKKLIDDKHLADFLIKCITLKYPQDICKRVKDMKYQDEIDFITTYEPRNKFISRVCEAQEGNTLVLFHLIDHGKTIHDLILTRKDKDRKLFFVYGGTDAETREQIRAIAETEDNSIIVASFGTFSTGVNIRNLHNIIFASPSKSKIRNLQSIGRGLRKGEKKEKARLIDISDDLRYKSHINYTLKHFSDRVKIYNEEKFDYKLYKMEIK